MEYKTHNTNDELTHWGIKGMRWGVRRYQNSDGSLTDAGKKRYSDEMQSLKEKERSLKKRQSAKDKFDRLNAKRRELEEWENELNGKRTPSKPVHKKTVSEMTNEELWERTSRLQAEANYYNAQKNLANANPPKVSAGQRFVSSLMNDVVAPAAKNVGKSWLENTLKDKLGLNNTDPLKELENEYKKLDWEKKIDNLKKGKSDDSNLTWEERLKKQQWETNERTRKKQEASEREAAEKAAAKKAEADAAEKVAKKAAEAKERAVKAAEREAKAAERAIIKEVEKAAKAAEKAAEKADKDTVVYGTKAYEKKVDKMLDKMDNDAWNLYYDRYYKQS